MDFETICSQGYFEPHIPDNIVKVHVDNHNPVMDDFLRTKGAYEFAFIPGQKNPLASDDEDEFMDLIVELSTKNWNYILAGFHHSHSEKTFHSLLILDVNLEAIRQFVAANNLPGFVYSYITEEAYLYCL